MKLVAAGSRILLSRLGQVAAFAAVALLVADRLGPEGQGRYSLTLALAMIVAATLNAGVGLAAVPPLRRGDVPPARLLRAQALWIAAVMLLLALLLVVGAVTGAGAGLARELGWSPVSAVAVLLAVAALVTFDVVNYDLLAAGHLLLGAGVNLVRGMGHLLLVGLLVAAGALDLTGAVVAWAAAQVFSATYLARRFSRSVAEPAATHPRTSRGPAGAAAVPPVPPPAPPAAAA
ncbi:MAG: hypothetical protein R6X25_13010, partial [Candidatus Krumholzibacteriia bacterium]